MPPLKFGPRRGRPDYESKADLFRALAHPARIRVLTIMCAAGQPTPVSEMLKATGIESTLLSQHLAVLKRYQVVTSERVGNAVYYQLATPVAAELLVMARRFLDYLDDQTPAPRQPVAVVPMGRPARPMPVPRRWPEQPARSAYAAAGRN